MSKCSYRKVIDERDGGCDCMAWKDDEKYRHFDGGGNGVGDNPLNQRCLGVFAMAGQPGSPFDLVFRCYGCGDVAECDWFGKVSGPPMCLECLELDPAELWEWFLTTERCPYCAYPLTDEDYENDCRGHDDVQICTLCYEHWPEDDDLPWQCKPDGLYQLESNHTVECAECDCGLADVLVFPVGYGQDQSKFYCMECTVDD